MSLSRRDFLLALSGGALSLTLSISNAGSLFAALPDVKKQTPYNLDNIVLYTQGREGIRLPNLGKFSEYAEEKTLSVATKLVLKTGEIIQTPVPIFSAHKMLDVKEHEKVFLLSQKGEKSAVLSPDLKTLSLLETPKGYEFSGHGVVLPDGEHAAISIRSQNIDKDKKRGKLGIYNLRTFKLEETYETGGYVPHDMVINNEKTHLVVTHKGQDFNYGAKDKDSEQGAYDTMSTEEEELYKGKVTLIRLSDFSLDHHIYAPGKATPLHMDITDNNKVYTVSNSFFEGKNPPWPLNDLQKAGKLKIYNPHAIVEYDLSNGQTREIISDIHKQRRSQSVSFNKQTNKISAVFVHTDTLVTIDGEGNTKNFDTKKFKISSPIGLEEIPGTSLIAIGGMSDNISLVDLDTMELVQFFKMPLYRSSHITTSFI